MRKKDMYNQSGCLDLTPFYALRNIEREERKKKSQIRYVRYFKMKISSR